MSISAVKEEVLERLRSMRGQLDSPLHQSTKQSKITTRRSIDISPSDSSPKRKPAKVTGPRTHSQILDMLENFQKVSPSALTVFLEHAKQAGVYKSVAVPSDKSSLLMRRSMNKTPQYEYPEIPSRFSKLVTFRYAPESENTSPKHRSSINRNKAFLQIDGITDLKRSRVANGVPIKLESIMKKTNEPLNNPVVEDDDDTVNMGELGFDRLKSKDQGVLPNANVFQMPLQDMISVRKKKQVKTTTVNNAQFQNLQLDVNLDQFLLDKQQSTKVVTTGAVSFYNTTQSLDSIIQKRVQMFSKMPKLAPLVEKVEKFHDFMRRLCNAGVKESGGAQTPGQNQHQKEDAQQQQTLTAQGSQGQVGLTTNAIKNLRLSKHNIKAHVSKRYGKIISERLMVILESCNKTMHNIEYNAYLELICYSFFSLQNVTVNGQIYALPNMYKMMYQIFDGGNKGFICEHDIFQIMWSLNNGNGTRNKGETSKHATQTADGHPPSPSKSRANHYNVGYSSYPDMDSLSMTTNFKDTFPKIKKSVYAEAFQQDFSVFVNEFERLKLQAHLNTSMRSITQTIQPNYLQPMNSDNFGFNSAGFQDKSQSGSAMGKYQVRQGMQSPGGESDADKRYLPAVSKQPLKRATSPPKKSTNFGQILEKKKPISYYKSIVEGITQHNKTAVLLSEDVKTSKGNQPNAQILNGSQPVNVSANAFSHFNPISQMMKEKKQYSKAVQDIIREDSCRQISFEQFLRISTFAGDIPQFLDDLFHYLTTISLKELAKKHGLPPATVTQAPQKKKSQLTDRERNQLLHPSSHTNPFLTIDREELNLMKRQNTFVVLQKHFDEHDIHRLMKGFQLLSQNGSTEKDIMSMFISQKSILENFSKVFKFFSESLALRFYNLLSQGISFNRIYFSTYLIKLHPLFSTELSDQMMFIFSLFDTDLDGQMNSKDISDFMNNVLACPVQQTSEVKQCGCRMFQEFEILYKDYVHQNILTYRVRKQMINFEFYLREVQYSCLINEFIDKLTLMWERPSLFSHEPKDVMLVQDFYNLDFEESYNKVSQINGQGYSNAVEKCIKRIKKFEQDIHEASNPTQHHYSHIQPASKNLTASQFSLQEQQNELQQQQLEEDFASMVLNSHKAMQEIQRIFNLDKASLAKGQRALKAKQTRLLVVGQQSIDETEDGDQSPKMRKGEQASAVPTLNLASIGEVEASLPSGK